MRAWDSYFVLLLAFGVVTPAAAFLFLGLTLPWSITDKNQIQVANIMVAFLTVDGLLLGLKTRLRVTIGTDSSKVMLAGAIEGLQMAVLTVSLFWSLVTMLYASFSTDPNMVSLWFKTSMITFYVAVVLYAGFAILSKNYAQPKST